MRAPSNLTTRDATILTPATTTDRYGDTIADWAAATSRTAKVWAALSNTNENTDHRTAISTALRATFLKAALIVAGERVVLDGITYDVVGEPNYARTPAGVNHIECDLTVTRG